MMVKPCYKRLFDTGALGNERHMLHECPALADLRQEFSRRYTSIQVYTCTVLDMQGTFEHWPSTIHNGKDQEQLLQALCLLSASSQICRNPGNIPYAYVGHKIQPSIGWACIGPHVDAPYMPTRPVLIRTASSAMPLASRLSVQRADGWTLGASSL